MKGLKHGEEHESVIVWLEEGDTVCPGLSRLLLEVRLSMIFESPEVREWLSAHFTQELYNP